MTKAARFVIGIDLGTTQCALSYVDLDDKNLKIKTLDIPQLVAEGQIEELPTLPSVIFLPEKGKDFARPAWLEDSHNIIGAWARESGLQIPARFVHSSKSWLCHSRVDRREPILPWQSEVVEEKLSPLQAATEFLRYMIKVWNHKMASVDDSFAFHRQKIVVTVPASFDPSARNLTLEAIKEAGIESVTLLEEPQAAFYDYIYRNPEQMIHDLKGVETILVIDIGGGTSDFSLIKINWKKNHDQPEFSRLAVGPHLLIGGDNLDLALARKVEAGFRHKGKKLLAKQWQSLLNQCHSIKEQALSQQIDQKALFTVSGAGSKVVAGAEKLEIPCDEIKKLLIDGFFPLIEADDMPDEDAGLGLSEAGLPFTRDPAITRHLAAFLHKKHIMADAVLFNGGTMKADCLRERLVDILSLWKGKKPVVLSNPHPTLAVSAGAAYYGLVCLGLGQRIQSGNPVAIYIGIGTSSSSTPERHIPEQIMCILPKGCETEKKYLVPDRTFGIDLSRDAAFYLFYTPDPPKVEQPGRITRFNSKRYLPLPPCTLKARTGKREKQVQISAMLKETGFMQIFCEEVDGNFSQQLRFDVARSEKNVSNTHHKRKAPLSASQLKQINRLSDKAFQESFEFNRLFKEIETIIGSTRNSWDTGLLRQLFDLFIERKDDFTSSQPAHTAWFRLLGFCLRPGFGAANDCNRIDRIYSMLDDDFPWKNPEFWSDWWVMLKRIAPGLAYERQNELKNRIEPLLFVPKKKDKNAREVSQHERNQLWRLLGHLERISIEEKERLGWFAVRAGQTYGKDQLALYAIGRLGARELAYAPDTAMVPASVAQAWADHLLKHAVPGNSYLDWALRELARKTGDRLVQIDEVLRKKILDLFKMKHRKKSFIEPLLKAGRLNDKELAEFTGETLPSGFVWVKES